ncbi:hypothetical protein ScPMuIL_000512 [Solemya velum]
MATELKETVSKTTICFIAGFATAAAAYGCYKLYKHLASEDEYFENVHHSKDPPNKRILVLGLDGAGKTRFVNCFRRGRRYSDVNLCMEPTVGFNVRTINLGTAIFDIWDVGGSESCRKYWKEFIRDIDVIVWTVDASNPVRLPESRQNLHILLEDRKTRGVPVLIVATKQDTTNPMTPEEILEEMRIERFRSTHEIEAIGTRIPLWHGERKGINAAFRHISCMRPKAN